jgi:hypothetical protein
VGGLVARLTDFSTPNILLRTENGEQLTLCGNELVNWYRNYITDPLVNLFVPEPSAQPIKDGIVAEIWISVGTSWHREF